MLSELQENYTKKSVGDLILNGSKVFFFTKYLVLSSNFCKFIKIYCPLIAPDMVNTGKETLKITELGYFDWRNRRQHRKLQIVNHGKEMEF